MAAEAAGCFGDVGVAEEAEQADRGVAQGGHDLGRGAGAYLGAVFVVGDVAHVVRSILDAPVAAGVRGEVGWVGLLVGQAGDAVDGLLRAGQAAGVADVAVDAEGLVDTGEVQACDVGGDGDGACLVTAVAAVKGDVVRGERTLRRGLGCRDGGRVGCL